MTIYQFPVAGGLLEIDGDPTAEEMAAARVAFLKDGRPPQGYTFIFPSLAERYEIAAMTARRGEWWPIAAAPEGIPILGFDPEMKTTGPAGECWEAAPMQFDNGRWECLDHLGPRDLRPTHWRWLQLDEGRAMVTRPPAVRRKRAAK